ncbi:hypothetical protein FNV43_RR22688 [Rhamnella rubrinervis]|uniref:BURP domain-containing protein n=1 Tax=Rhamnella rubrinervis TaxID=2594499 RepID=A0A8K0GNF1_9ROSA|nr:hypothetical protein FNV43_RR22688 [Rhamnella rubrinervis]
MGFGLASYSLLLHLLLVMCAQDSEEDNIIRLPGSNSEIHTDHDHGHLGTTGTEHLHSHQPSHINMMMHHINPSEMRFFTMEDMFVGKTMPVYFRRKEPSNSRLFLPRHKADSIPFSLKELPQLLQYFSISPDSPQAKSMEGTLRQCDNKPITGEVKLCATSLESMLDFNRGVFGLDSAFSVVTTTYFSDSNVSFQNYTILKVPKEILASKMVACHSLPYSYAVFYCHSQKSENKVYKVSLSGDNGDRIEAVAVCHMDTSQWSRNHASFRVLGIEPGTSPVCHFFPADNLIWVDSI